MLVGQRRQTWCPRCDELRGARPGSPCPVCSAPVVALGHASPAPSWRGRRELLLERLRAALPAARVVAGILTVLAVMAAAFVGGRSARPSSDAAAVAPATTASAGRLLPGGGLSTDVSRLFGWNVPHGQVTLTLNRITATAGTTRIIFEVSGLERDWTFGGVQGLRMADSAGRELVAGASGEQLTADELQDLGGGSRIGTIELSQRVDPNAVASVSVAQVLATRRSREELRGNLRDAELKRRMDSASAPNQFDRPGACADCTLEVHCADCETARVAGSTYRDGRVVVLLSQAGRVPPGESFANADILVTTDGPGEQIGSFESSTEGGSTVIFFDARDLASATPHGQERMAFDVSASVMRSEVLNGPWRIDQNGGQR
jgi:hypothetical protein